MQIKVTAFLLELNRKAIIGLLKHLVKIKIIYQDYNFKIIKSARTNQQKQLAVEVH